MMILIIFILLFLLYFYTIKLKIAQQCTINLLAIGIYLTYKSPLKWLLLQYKNQDSGKIYTKFQTTFNSIKVSKSKSFCSQKKKKTNDLLIVQFGCHLPSAFYGVVMHLGKYGIYFAEVVENSDRERKIDVCFGISLQLCRIYRRYRRNSSTQFI